MIAMQYTSTQGNMKIFATLLALAILKNQFGDDRDEWKMIEKKAKKFVKDSKIDMKPISKAIDQLFK
jgi:hypothetical protein